MGNDTFRQQFFGKSGVGKEQVWNRFVERPMYTTKNIRYEDIDFLCTIAILPQENIRSAVHLYTTVYSRHKGNCNIGTLTKQAKRMQVDITNINAIMNRLKAVK